MLADIEQKDREHYARTRVAAAGRTADGKLAEMIYDPDKRQTGFVVWDGAGVRYEPQVKLDDAHTITPYSPDNNLIKNRVVLFPTEAAEYESDEALVTEIQAFIHRYVDLAPAFERIAAHYVLFTWVYDAFNELPYLRFRGDFGSGKTRTLLTIGSLCYKPIFASGASSVSPLFRMLDSFRGTLVVDEGDFRVSDEKADLVKILNNGNARGFPVLRVEQNGNRKEFNPVAYAVFGPKLVGSRGFFQDRALESRFVTQEMGHAKLRADIPINLPASHGREATELRNRLLTFRFRNLLKVPCEQMPPLDPGLEPRLNQVLSPLMSVIQDNETREELKVFARTLQRDIVADRGADTEAQVLEIIKTLREDEHPEFGLSVKVIAGKFAERFGDDYARRVTAHWIGYVIRKRLGIKTERRRDGYMIVSTETAKLDRLLEKYGLASVNLENSVNLRQENEPPDPVNVQGRIT